MQFTTISFGIFFAIVFVLYWTAFRKSQRAQNALLLAASYLFYGCWDWRFLGLIIFTTLSTYATALYARGKHGKALTTLNIVINLAILAGFKYLGFFVDNFILLLSSLGADIGTAGIEILLPVGISFYTFQCIAYSVDVRKGRIDACGNLLDFATFVAYFPQLVAGPIERASRLLSQISRREGWNREFAVSGLRMVLFGVMKKVCIADMLAIYVDYFFTYVGSPTGTVMTGVLFVLQIYFDFSAYSEIARGASRMLGIELMANFRFPYFSRNIIEFWQRWHISLMWWFRDYVYIPLGGSRRGKLRTVFNLTAVFLLSGLWHGAAWNFVAWGAYWAIAYIIGKYLLRLKRHDEPISLGQLPQMALTMAVVTLGIYIFRCTTWEEIGIGLARTGYFALFFGACWAVAKAVSLIYSRSPIAAKGAVLICCAVLIAALCRDPAVAPNYWWVIPMLFAFAIEWKNRNNDYPVQCIGKNRRTRWAIYWLCLLFILLSEDAGMSFIYFQF